MPDTHPTIDKLLSNQSIAKTVQCLDCALKNHLQRRSVPKNWRNDSKQYKENKKCCGRRPIALPEEQTEEGCSRLDTGRDCRTKIQK